MLTFAPLRVTLAAFAMIVAFLSGCSPRAPLWLGGSPETPLVSPRALTAMAAALSLNDAQRSIASDLHAAYSAQHQQSARKYADYQKVAEGILARNKDAATVARRDEATIKFARHADRLADQFLEDLGLVLTPEQRPRWESALRALRRCQMLGPVYSEKSADLLAVVDGPPALLTPAERAAVAPTLDEWEIAIDAVLIRKAAFIRSTLPSRLQADREEDQQTASDQFRRWRLIVREERVLTGRAAAAISGAVPESAAAQVTRSVYQQTYPWLFQNAPTAEYIRIARETPDLPEPARAALDELMKQDELERADLAVATARSFEQWERTASDEQLASAGDHPEPPAAVLARFEAHERRVTDALANLLTPEQFEATGARRAVKSLPPIEFE